MTPKYLAALTAALAALAAPAPAQTPAAPATPAPTTPATPVPTTPATPVPAAPAAPLKLATVPADDPAVKAALAATDMDGARKLLGKPGAFQGKLVHVVAPSDYMILEFAPKRADALISFVAPANGPKFAGLAAAAEGKPVLVSGTFADYQGHMEIILTDPAQIKLIQ